MPRVPTPDAPRVSSSGLPGVRQQAGPGALAAEIGARQSQQFGQNLMAAGVAATNIATDMQQQANQLRVDDAVNQAKEAALKLTFDPQAGYTNVKGIQALQRESGQPLATEYGDMLNQQFESIAAGLGNDAQRLAFRRASQNIGLQFQEQATRYEGEQFRTYAASVREGTIANATNEIGLYYNDPQKIDQNILSIQAAVADLGRMKGLSASQIEAQTRKMTSNAHLTALSSALQKNDVAYADAYMRKYAPQMDADDMLRVNGLLTKQMDARLGAAAATATVNRAMPRIMPTPADRLVNLVTGSGTQLPPELTQLVAQAESGDRDLNADGSVVTSPKGAKGRMQVMDDTNRDPGYGVVPARDDSLEERARVGRDYFQAMLREYGGNLTQALAAYNAGPGNVNNALKAADKADDRANWMNYLPKPSETIPYVKGILAKYEAGQGAPAKPTLYELQRNVRDEMEGQSPERIRIALDETARQFEVATKAIKQRDDEAVAGAMRELIANGGRYSELPLAVRAMIPAGEVDKVITFAGKIAKGEDRTNEAVYQKLAGDPAYLRSLSDNEFFMLRGELSESDFKTFANQRGAAAGRATEKADDLNTAAINNTLNNRLATLKIDPSPKDGSGDAVRVGAIRKFVNDAVLSQQKVTGKQMTDRETEEFIDGLFAKSVQFRSFWFGTSNERMLTLKAGDIPSEVKTALKADFKKNGIDDPTDADLLGAYWRMQTALQRQRVTGVVSD
ncbi:transglycosylase SLT domain-containing protein [Achromobacter mucicolens]|uniref:transglycosylase SLT domain-containing protein n=1 Tax=Achromobacter mucicolens TaxID=1389922 RepID=UPI00244A33AD|nr:transglycosylase SLT domain-containing protein [Achromobacter mucicolens]MDG9966928.1 transglycosylase SLT domain-containing protein [Achromobacter mucicolens]